MQVTTSKETGKRTQEQTGVVKTRSRDGFLEFMQGKWQESGRLPERPKNPLPLSMDANYRVQMYKAVNDAKFVAAYRSDPFARQRALNLMSRGILLPSEVLANPIASI